MNAIACKRRIGFLVIAGTLFGVACAGAGAARVVATEGSAQNPPVATRMVLSASNFPAGATVLGQTASPASFLSRVSHSSAYTRSFTGITIGRTELVSLVSSAVNANATADATKFMSTLVASVHSKAQLKAVTDELTKSLVTGKTEITKAGLVRARVLKVGTKAVEYVLYLDTAKTSLEVGELFVQDRTGLAVVVYVSGQPGVTAAEDVQLARTMKADADAALAPSPANITVPAITGTLQLGQILTASAGAWTATAPTFQYQWLTCSATGTTCSPIAGATSATYTVSVANEGLTIAVSVTATSVSGGATATSPPTQVVP